MWITHVRNQTKQKNTTKLVKIFHQYMKETSQVICVFLLTYEISEV